MKSLCANALQEAHIEKLISLLSTRELNGGEAWSAFSSPRKSKSFER